MLFVTQQEKNGSAFTQSSAPNFQPPVIDWFQETATTGLEPVSDVAIVRANPMHHIAITAKTFILHRSIAIIFSHRADKSEPTDRHPQTSCQSAFTDSFGFD